MLCGIQKAVAYRVSDIQILLQLVNEYLTLFLIVNIFTEQISGLKQLLVR